MHTSHFIAIAGGIKAIKFPIFLFWCGFAGKWKKIEVHFTVFHQLSTSCSQKFVLFDEFVVTLDARFLTNYGAKFV